MSAQQPRAYLNGQEVDAVLVDAGGVLVDPNWDTIAEILAGHGIGVDPATLAAAEAHAKRELDTPELVRRTTDASRRERYLARLLRHAGITADPTAVEAATDEMEALHLERGLWEVVHQGAPEALDALRAAGLLLSLASNAEPLLRWKMGQLGLAHRFDHLAISGEVGVEKPNPRFFLGALEVLGVAPQRAIHVGDLYEIDVVGARAAGLEAVLVDAAALSGDRDVERIRSLAELPAVLGLE